MQRTVWSRLALTTAIGILNVVCATAATVYNTPGDWNGSRAVPTTLSDAAGEWPTGQLQWIVAQEGAALRYTYIFRNIISPSIGHYTLEVAGDCETDAACVTAAQKREGADGILLNINPAFIEFGTIHGIDYAIKFDTGDDGPQNDQVSYTFLSNRLPVWGDFYTKAGQTKLTNTGFGQITLESTGSYIARPGEALFQELDPASVPEPGSMWLLGTALLAAGMFRRHVRSRFTKR
jgi:hypothetical protein